MVIAMALMGVSTQQGAAQTNTGTVQGIARDSLQRPLAGVVLKLMAPDGSIVGQATSGADGSYRITGIAAGVYSVSGDKTGFESANAIVTLGASGRAGGDLTLAAKQALDLAVVAQHLTDARNNIEPGIGASTYSFTGQAVQNLPQAENAPLNQVLLQAPGVAQDNLANGALHVRNEHLNVQYRINGVIIPDGVSFFGQGLSPRFVDSMSLVDGALPAEYGLRTAGVVDINTKSGVFKNGGSVSLYGGSYGTAQPSVEYAGNLGGYNYFVAGDFMHNDHGINSPTPNYNAVHDETNQEHGFGYIEKIVDPTAKVSAMVGSFVGRFQIPNNPGQQENPNVTTNPVAGSSAFDSNAQNASQTETSHFGIVSYLKTQENFDYQVSFFSKYSTLHYYPDIYGDLFFTGNAQYALRQDLTNGIQAEGSYKLAVDHTVRGGVLVTGERTSSDTTSWVYNTADATQTPFPVVSNGAKTGWTYGGFLQDEWKILPTVTLNYGGRYDLLNTSTQESQISPRLNAVWTATPDTTVHAGYANYFTPPPFQIVSLGSLNNLVGTTGAPNSTTGSPVKAERSHYFDVGVTQEIMPGLKAGIDVYYKYSRNLIDEGQFGAPVILQPFNYHVGYNKGVELTTSYDKGPFSYYGNLAVATQKAEGINSSQFNFDAATLAYSNSHLVNTDHSQLMTASAGMSYLWEGTRFSVDILAGTGVRTSAANVSDGTFNNGTVPSYEQVNFGVSRRFEDAPGGALEIRLDLINVLDETYLIRSQSGIGVSAPQYGPRRTLFMGVKKEFN